MRTLTSDTRVQSPNGISLESSARDLPQGEACLALGPPAGQHVRLVARLAGPRGAEGQVLHPFRPRLELARDPRRHAKRVPRMYLDDLVVQLRTAAAGDHHVELLLLLLPVPERQPEVRRELLEAHA